MEAGLRLGVGKAEQESFYTSADNVVRKKLEVELQADENQERRDKREVRSLAQPQCRIAPAHVNTVQAINIRVLCVLPYVSNCYLPGRHMHTQ